MGTRANDLDGISDWSLENWAPRLDAVTNEHYLPATKMFGIARPAIDKALGGQATSVLWGCVFEDFLTRRYPPDDRNVVEVYLRRFRQKESVAARSYMTALSKSVMSLYEVSDVIPGRSFRARDLVRGGDPVLVTERSATKTLKAWDRVGARVVEHDGENIVSGGLLTFTLETSERLFSRLLDPESGRVGARHDGEVKPGALKGWNGSDDDLRRAAPSFTSIWLFNILPQVLGLEAPKLFYNMEGDEILFHKVAFPLKAGSAKAIANRLDEIDGLVRESDAFWDWVGDVAGDAVKGKKGMMIGSVLDDGRPVLGTIEIKNTYLLFEANSKERAQKGIALLTDVLGDLVSRPTTETQTFEQMQRMAKLKKSGPAAPIPAHIQKKIVHEYLDKQYRATIDKPVAMLGDISPREASRTAEGREKIVVWLKYLENTSLRGPGRDDPMTNYDYSWIWKELGVDNLRK